ncbi:uncharacterized protein L3040_005208 [Drepanopeziza brunnea f. sp. 'multigermtubi']|uniref:uncharacterized protein n=1 Tax=Drepanopeziza brunnea f. sp. 'multigermtubi' TaxID=698441 RepID=UPI00239E9000|nr:hypothetical protein L3040_005208 [Drepanopeziza brunnea f. sp. 'multigermtubi']
MKSVFIVPALLAVLASAAPSEELTKRYATSEPTVYLAGDSTMAKARSSSPTTGWGQFFSKYLEGIEVVNRAIGGRSARSFTREGRFDEILKVVKPGDFVIISFGHNDVGSPRKNDNGRSACSGSGDETCISDKDGEVVQTYPTYMREAGKKMIDAGARVIISSPTPKNICQSGKCEYTPTRFTDLSKQVVESLGEAASFIDHGQYVANEFMRLGKEKVDVFYPVDYTHPSPDGSKLIAELYVKAVLCSKGVMAPFVSVDESSLPGECI